MLDVCVHPFQEWVKVVANKNFVGLVLLKVFSDHEGQLPLLQKAHFEEKFNLDGVNEDFLPSGSIKQLSKTSLYGEFASMVIVTGRQVTDNMESFYAEINQGRTGAFEFLDKSGFYFSTVDPNGNPVIDMTVAIYSRDVRIISITNEYGLPAIS